VLRKSAHDSSGLPPVLLTPTPRHVGPSALGGLVMFIATALVVAGMWGGIVLNRNAETAARRVSKFASERILAAGDIVQLRKRGGDEGNRVTAHYRYTARGRDLTGSTALRGSEREKYSVGSPVGVWYLPTEPEVSWLDGYEPHPEARWPATVVPLVCGAAALALIMAMRRDWNLLAYGRPALAKVIKVAKKQGTHTGTHWMVHFEWTILSGATRKGKYQLDSKHPPALGQMVPIVYDRDNTHRHSKYPMSLVRVRT
jgi:hypothetical protein